LRLINEIGIAFLNNIKTFLQHPTLKYHWVRYIPVDHVTNLFWRGIKTRIEASIRNEQVFYPESDTKFLLLRAKDLRIVSAEYRDDVGKPLLRNLGVSQIWHVSESYDSMDLSILMKLGTEQLRGQEFLYQLAGDLSDSQPRMRSIQSDDWHTRVANILLEQLKSSIGQIFIKSLNLIPLKDGRWVTSKGNETFLPTVGDIALPTDLALMVIDPKALEIPARKQLFARLGVKECSPQAVFLLIEKRYQYGPGRTLAQSLDHISFIFWYHDQLPTRGISLRLASSWPQGRWFSPHDVARGWTYLLDSNDKYSVAELFRDASPNEFHSYFKHAHSAYYMRLKHMNMRNNRNAVDWFNEFLQIRDTPQLISRSSPSLRSLEVEYIAKHKPGQLLGVLRASWSQYRENWDDFFKTVKVPILDFDECRQLDTTYLPLPMLRGFVRDLKLEAGFGFIHELSGIENFDSITWRFLERFGVGVDANVDFWIRLLKHAHEQDKQAKADSVFQIYFHLQTYTGPRETVKIM
jgi:hypothetical protein